MTWDEVRGFMFVHALPLRVEGSRRKGSTFSVPLRFVVLVGSLLVCNAFSLHAGEAPMQFRSMPQTSDWQKGSYQPNYFGNPVVVVRQSDKKLDCPVPDFPKEAAVSGRKGDVGLKLIFSPAGKPEKVTVERSSGVKVLDETARAFAERRWHSSPSKTPREVTATVLFMLR